MELLHTILMTVHIIAGISVIGLVLLQHGKGADMGAAFGSGASGSLFGATGSANFLSRSTAVCAAVFFVSTLSLAFLTNGGLNREPASGGSVLDRAVVTTPSASGVPAAIAPVAPAASVAASAVTAGGAIPSK